MPERPDTLRREGSVEIELSDRADGWRFSRRDGQVKVAVRGPRELGRVEGWCSVAEFEQVVGVCLTDALRLLFREQPARRGNTYLQSLARQAAGD